MWDPRRTPGRLGALRKARRVHPRSNGVRAALDCALWIRSPAGEGKRPPRARSPAGSPAWESGLIQTESGPRLPVLLFALSGRQNAVRLEFVDEGAKFASCRLGPSYRLADPRVAATSL